MESHSFQCTVGSGEWGFHHLLRAQSYVMREKRGSADEAARNTRLVLFSKWLDQEFSAYPFNATTRNTNHDVVQETVIERANRESDYC